MHKLEYSSTLEVSVEVAPIAELALIAYAAPGGGYPPNLLHARGVSGSGPDTHKVSPAGLEMTCSLYRGGGACRKERPVSRHPVDQDERAIDDHERNPAPPSSSRTGQPTGCLKSACSSNFVSIAQLTVDALSTAVLKVG
jgi:hypothetical protein